MAITGSFWPMLAVVGFFIAVWSASKLARLLGVSSLLLEILTGIILGPECLGLMSREYTVCEHQRHTECQPPDDWRGRLAEGLPLGSQLNSALEKCDIAAYGVLLDLGGELGSGGAQGNTSSTSTTTTASAASTTLEEPPARVTTTSKRTTTAAVTSTASRTTTDPGSGPVGTSFIWPEVNETTTTTTSSSKPENDTGVENASWVDIEEQLKSITNMSWPGAVFGDDETTTTHSIPGRLLASGQDANLQYDSFEECLVRSCEDEVRAECSSLPGLFTLIGRAGVALMVFESGMLFDFTKVQEVGRNAWFAALFGTSMPLLAGTALVVGLGRPFVPDGLSAGIAVVPTSVAFAIRQLGATGMLQEPFSQALVAIAFVDEVISLFLFTILVNVADEFDYLVVLKPLIGLVLMPMALVAGSNLLPLFVRGVLLPKIPMVRDQRARRLPTRMRLTRDEVLFLLMLGVLIVYAVIMQLLGTHLWGCFIAGTTFACLDMPGHPGHALHVWVKQTKRVTAWMVRIFFACTVAFSIPVGEFFSINAFWKGAVLGLVSGLGTKVCCALWMDGGCIIGWAMVNRAELAFLIAQMAAGSNMLSQETYCVVIWALLLAAVSAPSLFHVLLRRYMDLNGIEDRAAVHCLSEEEEEDEDACGGTGKDAECVEEEMVGTATMKAHKSRKDVADVPDNPAFEGCLKDLDDVRLEEVNPEQECLTEQCRDAALDASKLEDGADTQSAPQQKAPADKKSRGKKAGKGTKNVKHAIFPGASPINTRGFLCCLFFRKIIVD